MGRVNRQALETATELMTEKELQSTVRAIAKQTGWLTYHTYRSTRSDRGFPDLVLVRPPRIIFTELKTTRGRIRPDQATWLDTLADCPGAETYLWRPSDLDTIARVLSPRHTTHPPTQATPPPPNRQDTT